MKEEPQRTGSNAMIFGSELEKIEYIDRIEAKIEKMESSP
jgi:hypothetical protein